jgi:uncharacterized protein YecE (DUF72 family)
MTVQSGIFVGTSGWSYPKGEGTWNGYFYPADRKTDELVYYSRFFQTVEINSTFYRPPEPSMAQSWVNRVPDDFLFTVKLWQKFTHPKMFEKATGEIAAISQDDVNLFCRGIEPLVKAGKLGALLAQFPPSFTNDRHGKDVLQGLITHFGQYHLAVELRHRSWSDDPATARLLSEANVAWVQIDEPKFSFSLGANVPQTSDLAYFRFHGRNKEMWWKGDVETRYCYLYSADEIKELAARVKSVSEKSRLCFVFFNNHWKAYAPRNATDIMKALDLPLNILPLFRDQLSNEE